MRLKTILKVSPGKIRTGTLRSLLWAVGWELEKVGRLRTKQDPDVFTYTAAPIASFL